MWHVDDLSFFELLLQFVHELHLEYSHLYLFVAIVALEEVLLLVFAPGGWVEVVMVAVLELAHEEVAGIDCAVDSDLWIGHDNITYCGDIQKLKQNRSFWRDAGLGELIVGPYFSIFERFFLL